MISLFDANMVIALFDAAHVHHKAAHAWMSQHRQEGWATCPLTQNACIRIISQSAYPGRLTVSNISRRLHHAISAADHHFWADSISLCEALTFDHSLMLTPRHLTDHYLLALATTHGGRLVTFDQGITIAAVRTAQSPNLLVL